MASVEMPTEASQPGAMRIAVEGCGHGTLDAIYASIEKSCKVKGWDGVDLVIIGGDFQAVRDRYDLNVTAMPAKYRDMADFHQYYRGTKTAPYLTIFVGGNHEASNHLFELYYGGWVAPNIYYLGAANVIQVGPLKIAGMSGIWKGYDYRKPHYERLPYSKDDMYSVYHVRELDVRKLLSLRSQVDIGISHDWPKGIEWLGDYNGLFKHKPFLREDAQSGKLGNTAAQQVMDRLRPRYWFSAHLHTRYSALKSFVQKSEDAERIVASVNTSEAKKENLPSRPPPHQEQLSAWNTFGDRARKEEAAETAQLVEDEKSRREEADRTGVPLSANYTLNETYKKVRLGNGFARDVTAVSYSGEPQTPHDTDGAVSQLDGTCASLPLKRRRDASSPPNIGNGRLGTQYSAIQDAEPHELTTSTSTNIPSANPDAIDIDMSDGEETQLLTTDESRGGNAEDHQHSDVTPATAVDTTISASTAFNSIPPNLVAKAQPAREASAELEIDAETFLSLLDDNTAEPMPNPKRTESMTDQGGEQTASNEISEDVRAQLAALSSKFQEPIHVSPSLPHPEDIKNQTTRFLALSKCEDKQNFLQLIEIEPYAFLSRGIDRPVRLEYVPEWLAILRVFAPELTLGGTPKDQVSQHRGDTFYRERIIEEEVWIEENVVKTGGLIVPENFVKTTPDRDLDVMIDDRDMPREVTNPQTSSFCKLIGIENLFDISEADRDARMAAGPAESTNPGRQGRGDQGRRGGRGNYGNRDGFARGGRGRGSRGQRNRGGRG